MRRMIPVGRQCRGGGIGHVACNSVVGSLFLSRENQLKSQPGCVVKKVHPGQLHCTGGDTCRQTVQWLYSGNTLLKSRQRQQTELLSIMSVHQPVCYGHTAGDSSVEYNSLKSCVWALHTSLTERVWICRGARQTWCSVISRTSRAAGNEPWNLP